MKPLATIKERAEIMLEHAKALEGLTSFLFAVAGISSASNPQSKSKELALQRLLDQLKHNRIQQERFCLDVSALLGREDAEVTKVMNDRFDQLRFDHSTLIDKQQKFIEELKRN